MKQRWIRIFVPVVLIAVWFAVAGAGGPIFGKISSVSSNDQASFLPANAMSTEVQALQSKFTTARAIPAIVVVESDQVIPQQSFAEYALLATKLSDIPGVQPPVKPAATSVVGPIPSTDGRAVEFIVPISDTGNVKRIVPHIREAIKANQPDGTHAYVTGPAGLSADLVKAFGGIDGILLLVAVGAVFVILLAVYRSIVLPFVVLITAMFALCASILVIYYFASWGWIKLNGQSQGILSILVIGATTDYSLLLVARYREALEQTASKWEAITRAFKVALEPVAASAATVILALLCLLFSDLNSNRSLGPIAAIGIAFSLLAATTFLPAILVAFGRGSFWPYRPKIQTAEIPVSSIWKRVGSLIKKRPRAVWVACLAILLLASAGLLQLRAGGVAQTELILAKSDAVDGQKILAKHFDGGSGSPVVIIAGESKAGEIASAIRQTDGISPESVYAKPIVKDGKVLINATLAAAPDSEAAVDVVRHLRTTLPAIDKDALVGGVTATAIDTNDTAQRDLVKIIPIVLLVILVVLMLLLRSILAPVLLIGSVILSYAAALGVSALVFNHLFHFPGADASVPLFGFVFLVALGVDYNIFLMTRVREEALQIGTRPGILHGLGRTGGVITSAGVVLAATFAALGIIPILFLVQIAFIVAFGVLLDTLVVRSFLVPALAYDFGKTIWWPSKLSK